MADEWQGTRRDDGTLVLQGPGGAVIKIPRFDPSHTTHEDTATSSRTAYEWLEGFRILLHTARQAQGREDTLYIGPVMWEPSPAVADYLRALLRGQAVAPARELTLAEASQLSKKLGRALAPNSLSLYCERGELHARKVGSERRGYWLVTEEELRRFIETRRGRGRPASKP